MTERFHSLLVVLEKDMRSDDPGLEDIITSINQLRGVSGVQENKADLHSVVGIERAKTEFGQKLIEQLIEFVYPTKNDK